MNDLIKHLRTDGDSVISTREKWLIADTIEQLMEERNTIRETLDTALEHVEKTTRIHELTVKAWQNECDHLKGIVAGKTCFVPPEFQAHLDSIRAAAQAVVDRWETPLWKDVPATGVFIYALRDALKGEGK